MNFYALEYNGQTITIYTGGPNGQLEPCTTRSPCSASLPMGSAVMGSPAGIGIGTSQSFGLFYGYMSNLQAYDTMLSYNSVTALYQEGIGGTPIDLQNLIGWWPLNGNSNDYSSDGSINANWQGNPSYISNWWASYNPP